MKANKSVTYSPVGHNKQHFPQESQDGLYISPPMFLFAYQPRGKRYTNHNISLCVQAGMITMVSSLNLAF